MTNPKSRPPRSLTDRVVGSFVAPLVRPVVDAVDVGDVVDRVDIDDLLERIDIDALMARIDPNLLLERIDVNLLLSRVEADQFLDQIDVNLLLDRVDVNRVLDRVEPDQLLDRVDANRLLDRVDPERLLARIDPNALVDRVDLNTVMGRVDVNALVQRTELGEIIARSTTGVFGQLVDLARTAIMAVDLVVHGLTNRILRRTPTTSTPIRSLPAVERAVVLQGQPSGVVTRFLAFLLDTSIASTLFAVGAGLMVLALNVVSGVEWVREDHRLAMSLSYITWQLLYFAGSTALTGRTIGKAVLGVRVIDRDGTSVSGWHALIRTVMFPVSFLLFGIGFLLGLVRRDRRMLHDLIGSTAVVYSWDAEVARLRAGGRHHPMPTGSPSPPPPQLAASSDEAASTFDQPARDAVG